MTRIARIARATIEAAVILAFAWAVIVLAINIAGATTS